MQDIVEYYMDKIFPLITPFESFTVWKLIDGSNWTEKEKKEAKDIDHKIQSLMINLKYSDGNHNASTIYLNDLGHEVQKSGGYYTFIGMSKKAKENEEKVNNLEMQKLRGEVELISNQLLDYDKVKKRSIRNEWLTIVAIILTLIGLLLQWLNNKYD